MNRSSSDCMWRRQGLSAPDCPLLGAALAGSFSRRHLPPPSRGPTEHHRRHLPLPRLGPTEHHRRHLPPPSLGPTEHHRRHLPPPRLGSTEHHRRHLPLPRLGPTEHHRRHLLLPSLGPTEHHRRHLPPPSLGPTEHHHRPSVSHPLQPPSRKPQQQSDLRQSQRLRSTPEPPPALQEGEIQLDQKTGASYTGDVTPPPAGSLLHGKTRRRA